MMNWVMSRLRNNLSVHVLAAGMSRSASTWQFNALRVLLEHAVESINSPIKVYSAHGHRFSELEPCLLRKVCVVKMHEFNPDILHRVHVVFLTHRDLRDVLLSSAGKINACLHSGKQSVESSFVSYAAWLPFACIDMQYEEFMETGAPFQIAAMADRLGIPRTVLAPSPSRKLVYWTSLFIQSVASIPPVNVISATSIAHEVSKAQRASRNVNMQKKTGFMPGHGHHVTTSPKAYTRLHTKAIQRYVARGCDLEAELRSIEIGWGGWLLWHNYSAPTPSNLFVDQLPQKPWLMKQLGQAVSHCPYNSSWRKALVDEYL